MQKLHLFFLTLIFIPSFSLAQDAEKASPNIIYILADDLGYGDLSCYNPDGKIMTPHLDSLAAGGIRFTDAHTTSAVCSPTRYSILTGRYNWRSRLKEGVLTGKSPALIDSSRLTVGKLLQRKGYRTAAIGKWHLGWTWATNENGLGEGDGWSPDHFSGIDFSKPVLDSPNEHGFNYTYLIPASLDIAPYVYLENGRSTTVPVASTVNTGTYSWWREGPTAPDFVHEEVTPRLFQKATEFMMENSSAPFYIYLPLPSPHTPILPLPDYQGKSKINPYGDFMMQIDDHIGELIQQLKKTGKYENTMIIFTSDNGCSPAAKIEEMIAKGHHPSAQFRGHKADIFEGGHRVPFILSWPAAVQPQQVSEKLISTADLMATLAELIDVKLSDNEGEDSFSFLSEVRGGLPLMAERESLIMHSINGSFAFREGNYKLILCPGSGGWSKPKPKNTETLNKLPKYQLYNLSVDAGETNNLYLEKPELAKRLKLRFLEIVNNGRSTKGLQLTNDLGHDGWPQLEKIR